MTRALLLILAALLTLPAQDPSPRHDKYRDDPHAYCWRPESSGTQTKVRERDPHAHKCACHLMCAVDPETGEPLAGQEQESATCELYCTKERCTCHVEEPCEGHH